MPRTGFCIRCAVPGQKAIPIPAGSGFPGTRRSSETAAALRRIAAESGPEAVAFGVTTSSGTALSDAQPWVDRLINAFGSPNNCNSMEICAWHRQFARAFTTGTGIGTPDYAEAGCILLWGHNPSTSLLAGATRIAEARARGAKLIVIDPRHIGFAVKADCWLPVRPGTDAALALALAGIMIEEGWFDAEFVRDWTNGPFLVREDDGQMLRADALAAGAEGFVAWDEGRGLPLVLQHRFPGVRTAAVAACIARPVHRRRAAMARSPAAPFSTSMPRSAGRCRPTVPPRSAASSRRRSAKRRGCCGSTGRWRITPGPGSSSRAMRRKPTGRSRSCMR